MLRLADAVRPAVPRANVLLTLPDGRIFEAPIGMTLAEILQGVAAQTGESTATPCGGTPRAVAALVNGRLRDLTTPLTEDASVVPVMS